MMSVGLEGLVVTKEAGRVGFPHINKQFPLGSTLFKWLQLL